MTERARERIEPLAVDEWSDETREVLLRYLRRPELYLSGRPDALPMPVVMGLYAHHVALADKWLAFSDMLASSSSTIEPRLRELVICRVAWKTSSSYEWYQHVRMGAQEGLSTEQLYGVAEGADVAVWTPLERALLKATDETIDAFAISEGTWNELAAELDDAQLFELVHLIGGYLALATVMHSVGLRADPPEQGVDAPVLLDPEA